MDGRMLFKQMPHNDQPGKKIFLLTCKQKKLKMHK